MFRLTDLFCVFLTFLSKVNPVSDKDHCLLIGSCGTLWCKSKGAYFSGFFKIHFRVILGNFEAQSHIL